ncbi:NAD(P)-dependent oxidoreductase [Propionivibrio dicarboxylicus]|uniref:3-hydroxyisobutyrate dehydrogenase n=1 Tax=Propionivibrio dicarboxylicus TaxID=83767 RepID=A0A1G8EU11_9RHOO|nr:NAD(P)-dependent oxidoreductase [Propionivibrio dicarboxylicus]SDH73344.1 3-hydroxyisobutyrate dehydrogenase [Propionivibrio dicarboxylicus]
MTTTTWPGSIGFIGLGAMGGAVAQRLSSAWKLKVFDLSPAAVEAIGKFGAVACASPAEAMAGAAVVFSCLPTPELVEAFWTENGKHLGDGAIAVDLSTIDPATSRRVATLIERQAGAKFVACTMGKTPAMAREGKIPVFVGGDAAAVEKLRPVLAVMANAVFDMGSVEGATMFKLISNLIGMTNLAVLAEGHLLAQAAGIDPATYMEALRTTGGWSVQADIRLKWMMERDFAPRFAVDLAAKDLRLSVNAAAQWGIPTPVAAAGLSVFSLAHAAGLGAKDAAAIVEPLTPKVKV